MPDPVEAEKLWKMAADDMRATGYDFANAEDTAFIYGLQLKPAANT